MSHTSTCNLVIFLNVENSYVNAKHLETTPRIRGKLAGALVPGAGKTSSTFLGSETQRAALDYSYCRMMQIRLSSYRLGHRGQPASRQLHFRSILYGGDPQQASKAASRARSPPLIGHVCGESPLTRMCVCAWWGFRKDCVTGPLHAFLCCEFTLLTGGVKSRHPRAEAQLSFIKGKHSL